MGAITSGSENMAINRRGVFYTITAIILVVIIIFAFKIFEVKRDMNREDVVLARVKTTNQFVRSIERDLQRAINIAALRATLALEEKIAKDGAFLTDAAASYEEAVMNGTINGIQAEMMIDSTFPDWIAKIQSEASKTGVTVEFEVHDIEIYQDDAWSVKGKANMTINITDIRNTSQWLQQKEVIATMNIIGLEDPLYAVKTYGRVPNVINMTPYEGNYTSGGDVSNLLEHAENGYYAENTNAPSFLMRFEGDLSSSPYGIESMVNIEELEDQGIGGISKTTLDYLYWGTTGTTDYQVTGMPIWYYIDSGHETKYQVTGLTY